MIYLFCNEGYGRAFIESAQKYSSLRNCEMAVVFSSKRIYPKSRVAALARKLIGLWADKYRQMELRDRWKMRLFIVEDVNAARFYRRLSTRDVGIIAGFNQIFRKELIERFGFLVNFHPSILPLYRGPVPSYWCIRNKEEKSGYTLHSVTEGIDSGEILYQKVVDIGRLDDPDTLDRRIASEAAMTLWHYLDFLQSGCPWAAVQLDAYKIYKIHVNYASFPNRS
jgi:methionyl-tRNA formyltransferase